MTSSLVDTYRNVLPQVSKKSIDLHVLSQNDSKGFWSIVTYCSSELSSALNTAIDNADVSHSSTVVRPDPRTEHAIIVILLRLVGYGEVMDPALSPGGYEAVLEAVLPSSKMDLLLTLSSVLSRFRHRNTASVVLSSLLGSNRRYLALLPAYSDQWLSRVTAFAHKMLRFADLGRYERKSQDIMSSVEECYRLVTRLKSFLNACPFVAEHFKVQSLLDALAIITDIITPALYHYVLTADKLASKRFQLQGIVAEIHNVAIDTAVALLTLVYETRPEVGNEAEVTIRNSLMSGCNNTCSVALYRSSMTLRDWLRSVHGRPPLVYKSVQESIAAASQVTNKLEGERTNFFEVGVSDSMMLLGGGSATGVQSKPWSTSAAPPAAITDPRAAQVAEMFPDWPVDFVRSALANYNDNVEQLVNDALMGNLPPDLMDTLAVAQIARTTRDAMRHVEQPTLPPVAVAAPPPSAHVPLPTGPASYDIFQSSRALELARQGSQLWGGIGLDDDTKSAIRQLSEIVYEDEYDDTEEVGMGGPLDSYGDSEDTRTNSMYGGDAEDSDPLGTGGRPVGRAANLMAGEHYNRDSTPPPPQGGPSRFQKRGAKKKK